MTATIVVSGVMDSSKNRQGFPCRHLMVALKPALFVSPVANLFTQMLA